MYLQQKHGLWKSVTKNYEIIVTMVAEIASVTRPLMCDRNCTALCVMSRAANRNILFRKKE
jgi:hypothetical protein